MIGQFISRYKILEKLGEGGMGAVYQAEDTDLGRPVALKFLAAHLLHDDEAKQRFIREAKAAAAITHPNICHVYEVGEADGKTFLAMAYLEGESLEDRIAKRPLPLKDVLDIGRQVAEGLEAAHEKGIVHRDIKPANIMVDAKGRATILDFGLARLTEGSKLTRPDQTVGTAAYMSPEQMLGGEVDQRTDIWALGCVLYEMVAGVRPFPGQYDQALAYEIVNQDPEPLTGVRAGVPMELEVFVGKCLAKDPVDRYGSADELAKDLRTLGDKLRSGRSTVLQTAAVSSLQAANSQATQPKKQWGWAVLAAALAGAAISWWLNLAAEVPAPQSVVFTVEPPEGVAFEDGLFSAPLISPDGSMLAFVDSSDSGQNLWIRPLDSLDARRLEGTAGAGFPFWSPDSRHLGFFADRKLKRVDATGGPVQTLCDARDGRGGTWTVDDEGNGVILFAPDTHATNLYVTPADGGDPVPVTEIPPTAPGEFLSYRHPRFLPGARQYLFLRRDSVGGSTHEIQIGQTDSTSHTSVLRTSSSAWYAPPRDTGSDAHLLYVLDETLFAQPFDPVRGEVSGERIAIAERVLDGGDKQLGGFSVSETGTLVYRSGGAKSDWQLTWFDRQGNALEAIEDPGWVRWMRLSPDESRLAMSLSDENGNDLWIRDLSRSVSTRLTFDGLTNRCVVWSPDGSRVAYPNTDGSKIFAKRADGSGEAAEIAPGIPGRLSALWDWSRDGRYLTIFTVPPPYDMYALPLGGGEPIALETQDFGEIGGSVSPDGKWITYYADGSGRREVFVRPFPKGAGRWQISSEGGTSPVWSDDGSQIYYFQANSLMSAPVSTTPTFQAGAPEPLFEVPGRVQIGVIPYDVTADNQRIVVAYDSGGASDLPITVVTNWQQALLR